MATGRKRPKRRSGPLKAPSAELERRYWGSSRRQAEALFARDARILAVHAYRPVDVEWRDQWVGFGGAILLFMLTGPGSSSGSLVVTYQGPVSAARFELPPVPRGSIDWSLPATLVTVAVCGLLGWLDTQYACGGAGRSTLAYLPAVLVIGAGAAWWPNRRSPNWWGIVGTVLGGLFFFGVPHILFLLC